MFPSGQGVPTADGAFRHPVIALHESMVQTLLSLHTSGAPIWHNPPAVHVSAPLHASPSEHDDPAALGVWKHPVPGSQPSVVQGLASAQSSAVPGWHDPEPLQIS